MTTYRPDELAARLKVEGEAVLAFFKGLSPDQWDQNIYSSGSVWTARDILAHFIAAEKGFHDLIQNVMNGGPGAGADIDVDAYNAATVRELRGQPVDVMLAQFAMVRERSAALVSALRPDQLTLRGRHPNLGESALDEMVRAIYHHNSLHLRDVRHALRASRRAKPGAEGTPAL